MAEFMAVANVDDVPPGTATVVTVEGIDVALVNVDGRLYAVDNECTHLGGYLGEGEINPDWSDWAIECPFHASVVRRAHGRGDEPASHRASADLSAHGRRLGDQGSDA